MQKLLAAVAVVATFASAAGRPIELPTSASASSVGDPGLEVARGGGMGGGGFRPAVGGMGAGTGGGMMNSGGGMGSMGPGMNSGGVGARPSRREMSRPSRQIEELSESAESAFVGFAMR